MAEHIEGPLYYERLGRSGPVMAFVHPNPMDQSCWIFQMAHLSTWYRCIAIDIPGYGRSPKATRGLTMSDMAQACWEAIDDAMPGGVVSPRREPISPGRNRFYGLSPTALLLGGSR